MCYNINYNRKEVFKIMNNCPNCGSKVNQGEAFCKVCGAKLPLPQNITNNTQQYQQFTNQNIGNINQPISYQNINNQQENLQQPQNNIYQNNMVYNNDTNDEYLINSYIGKNAEKLKNRGFSINTFFFGSLYILYRKMWLFGFIWLAISIISNMFLPSVSGYIATITNIIASTQFKKYYLKHVEEQVDKIKSENPDKTKEQLMMICSQKGGTTVVPVIIAIILYCITIFMAISAILDEYEKAYNNNNVTNNTGAIGNLDVTIPSNLIISNYSTDNYKIYRTDYNNDENCSLTLSTVNASYHNNDAKKYLEETIYYSATDTYSGINQKTVNNNTWYYATVTTSYNQKYYYSITNNNTIYKLDFEIYSDDNKACSSAYNIIINSLEFK